MRFNELVLFVALGAAGCSGGAQTTASSSGQGSSSGTPSSGVASGSSSSGTVSGDGASGSSSGRASGSETAGSGASALDASVAVDSSVGPASGTIAGGTSSDTGAASGESLTDAGADDTDAGQTATGTGAQDGGDAAPSGASGTGGDASSSMSAVTLFVAGDSTAAAYGAASVQQGWGEHLADFLNMKVHVDDEGFPGRNVETFMYGDDGGMMPADHYKTILDAMKPGDYVMIEFGINDSSPGSPRFLTIPVFTQFMGTMVDDIVAKKGNPILVTPSALQYWTTTGMETNTREQPYADAMKQLAMQKDIPLADLNGKSVAYLNQIGEAATAKLYFNGDKAHFVLAGAVVMAKFVIQEVVRVGGPLGAYAVNLN